MNTNLTTENDAIHSALNFMWIKSESLYCHSVATANVAVRIAKVLGPTHYTSEEVFNSALLHDIGKVYVKQSILEKQGPLNLSEWEEIRLHPQWGVKILSSMWGARLRYYSKYVLQHHETPDETGYPNKVGLDDIHEITRIINISDRFVAMIEDRPYRKALNLDLVIKTLHEDLKLFFSVEYCRILDVLEQSQR